MGRWSRVEITSMASTTRGSARLNGMTGSTGFEFLRVRRDGGEEVPLDGGDRIEPRLGEHEFVELFSRGPHR